MKKYIHYIKIDSDLHENETPVIKLEGSWLTDFGFEANQTLKVEMLPSQIIMTITSDESVLIPDLMSSPYDYGPERSIIDHQRLNASIWLDKCMQENSSLETFMKGIGHTYVLRTTVFDLIHVLHENNLLKGSIL